MATCYSVRLGHDDEPCKSYCYLLSMLDSVIESVNLVSVLTIFN